MKKVISLLIVFTIVTSGLNYVHSENITNPKFIIIRQDKRADSLSISGIFINTTKDRIYNFKNVKILIKPKADAPPITFEFNDRKLEDMDLSAGCYIKWRFFISDARLKKISSKNMVINCDFNYLTEFNNAYDKGIHIFFDNEELFFSSDPIFVPDSDVILIPYDIFNYIAPKAKNRIAIRPPKKNNKNIVVINAEDYITLDYLKQQLKPGTDIFINQNSDYTNLTIYKE